jgi:hypothetical protein
MTEELNTELVKELARMTLQYQENIYPILGIVIDAKAAM